MRELLRQVYDRLSECESGQVKDPQDPHCEVRKLRRQIGLVLDRGYFDARMTDIDICQLPEVL